MSDIAPEARFMGAVTALTMHEMQNILAIIRESAGLMGDILKVNAKVDFKHRPNMERTLEHITSHVDRGKGLLEATSRLAHSPDDDMLEGCDLGVHARTVALLSERLVRLKGASVSFSPPTGAMPVAVGALEVLMTGYRAVQWAVGNGIKDGVVRMEVENGATHHVLSVRPPKDAAFDLNGVADLDALMKKGRVEWDGTRLRILLPVRRQD
jgi:hypothetical protein